MLDTGALGTPFEFTGYIGGLRFWRWISVKLRIVAGFRFEGAIQRLL